MSHEQGPPPARSVPPLWRSLPAAAPSAPPAVPHHGPRRWWGGALDVEGLAIGAITAFIAALNGLAPKSEPGRFTSHSNALAASFASLNHLRIDGEHRTGFAPLSGFHRTADGWVRLHANYPHHETALLSALGARESRAIPAAVSRRTSREVEEVVTARGGLAAAVRAPHEWLTSDTAGALAQVPWIAFDLQGGAKPAVFVLNEGPRPLHGLRILDLTRVIAGPSATRLLGALGADVLRIDPPDIPELWDHHVDTGFDKRSAIADLRNRTTRQRVHDLLAAADAVMLGYRSDGLRKFGFDPESLRETHPHLAVVAIDSWGVNNARAGRRGFDSIVQAATGIAHVYGHGDGDTWRPGTLPVQALDHATGLGMGAALLALLRERRDGRCGSAHLSLARTALELLRAPVPNVPTTDHPSVELRRMQSRYGELTCVPPPLTVSGQQLEYASPPVPYGSSELVWADDTETYVSP